MVTKHTYDQFCELIWRHNRLYYIEHTPEISDEEYDALFRRLEQMEKEHPEWISPSSPTQRVNESQGEGFKTIVHRIPMLSLANTYSKEEIEDFIARIQKQLGNKPFAFSAELKMDGIAISATFEKGRFVRGVTRGDGKSGDDITANMRTISNLPLQLYGNDIPEFMELRGEVFMPRKVFQDLNEQKMQDGEPLWANPRNAAAGSLKLLDSHEAAKRGLSVVFYGLAEETTELLTKQSDLLPFLQSLGLPALEYSAYCHSIDELWAFAEKIRSLRFSLPYDIDGIVIKINDLKDQKRLASKVYDNEFPTENLISFNINEKGEIVFNIPYPASEREKLSVIHEQLRLIIHNLYSFNENKPEKQYSKLFELRYNQNLKLSEIAYRLNISESQASQRLFELLAKLNDFSRGV